MISKVKPIEVIKWDLWWEAFQNNVAAVLNHDDQCKCQDLDTMIDKAASCADAMVDYYLKKIEITEVKNGEAE